MPLCLSYDTWEKYPPLTPEQQKLVWDNRGLIFHMYFKLPHAIRRSRGKKADLIQEGYVALARAVQNHDPAKALLSTYACTAIFSRMARFAVRNCKTYIVPKRFCLRDVGGLPPETSKDAWGEHLIGSYCDPILAAVDWADEGQLEQELIKQGVA